MTVISARYHTTGERLRSAQRSAGHRNDSDGGGGYGHLAGQCPMQVLPRFGSRIEQLGTRCSAGMYVVISGGMTKAESMSATGDELDSRG